MSEMKNLRQHPIEHLRGVIPGIRPFPDAADVFAEPVEKYARHFLPLVTIDLALLDDAWSGPIHLVAPCEPYEGQVGEWGGEEFGNALLKPDWLAFKLDEQGKYELLGDWRYFMLEQDRADWAEKSLDWREVRTQHRELVKLGVEPPFELHHEAKYSWRDVMELHYATQHAAYEQARRDFLAHGWNAANEWDDPAEVAKLPLYEPGTDCYETSSGRYLLGVLGGMGPLATLDFQRRLLDATPAQNDQQQLPSVVWNVPQIADRQKALAGSGPSPLPQLIHGIEKLN